MAKGMLLNVDMIYPIGSIYMNINNVDPSTLFGGTWERIQGRYLVGSGTPTQNTYEGFGILLPDYIDPTKFGLSLGITFGEYLHQLTEAEMPRHRHQDFYAYDGTAIGVGYWDQSSGWTINQTKMSAGSLKTGQTGGDSVHNNMPPSLVVNIWKRIA